MADLIIENEEWDVQKLSFYLWQEDVDIIKQIVIIITDSNDNCLWHFDKRGAYSVKNAYKLYMNLKDHIIFY